VFKKEKSERYLTVPSREVPKEGEIDMNKWLRDLHDQLKEKLEEAITPLETYLEQFNDLIPILQMKPEEIIKTMDEEDEENPK
jgi:hypothetical protein